MLGRLKRARIPQLVGDEGPNLPPPPQKRIAPSIYPKSTLPCASTERTFYGWPTV